MLYKLCQPSQSSCLSRCFVDLLGRRNHRCADFSSYAEAGGSLLNTSQLVLCMKKKNMSSSISTEHSCKFTVRGDLHENQPEVTEEFDMLLLSGHKNHRQLIQTLNMHLHKHSTCSASRDHGIPPSFHFQTSACPFLLVLGMTVIQN